MTRKSFKNLRNCLIQSGSSFDISVIVGFVGGNQRDLAREKAAKKAADLAKSKAASDKEGNKGLSLEARKQR